jgi:hypothetical protein
MVSRRPADVLIGAAVALVACHAPSHNGDLKAVRGLGPSAVPALRTYLLHGPEQGRVDRVRHYLERMYDTLATSSPSPAVPLQMTKSLVVRTFLGNLDATYRARSAQALQRIGGTAARAALDSARHLPLRADVAYAVQSAFDSLPP